MDKTEGVDLSSYLRVKAFFELEKSRRLKRIRIFYYSLFSFTLLLHVFVFTGLDRFANWVYNIEEPDNLFALNPSEEISRHYINQETTSTLKVTFALFSLAAIIFLLGTTIYLLFKKEKPVPGWLLLLVVISGLFYLGFISFSIYFFSHYRVF